MEPVNPYAAPSTVLSRPIEVARPVTGRVRLWFAQVFAILLVVGSGPAAAFAVWGIETIIGSGLAIGSLAIALIFLALPRILRPLLPIAVASLGIVAGVFLTIYLNSWGPTDAQKPIGIATVVCACVMQAGWIAIAVVAIQYGRAAKLNAAADDDVPAL